MAVHCPLCGQLVRYVHDGVFLSQKRAQIYAAVKHAGPDGIGVGDLASRYAMREVTVRNHVRDINERLAEADSPWRIRGRRWGYVLIREDACASLS